MSSYIAVEAQVKKSRSVNSPVSEIDDLTPIQRAVRLTHLFDQGEGLTIEEVMKITGLTTRRGAQSHLNTISGVLAIYEDEDHVWQLLVFKEMEQ